MGAGRDFGHDAAIRRMLLGLRADDVGQDFPRAIPLALDHGSRGLVAGGLDSQHQHLRVVIQFMSLDSSLAR